MTCAKITQSIPELKRDGNTVLSAYSSDQLYDEASTSRANSVLEQMKALPKLVKQLQDDPNEVIKDFEEMRKCCEPLFSHILRHYLKYSK